MDDPVRRTALDILLHLDRSNDTLDACLDRWATETAFPSRRDRRFIYALVFGVLRHRGRLDWILAHCSAKPFKNIDPPVLASLRMGLFQILLMGRVPVSAAVNTSVELAKKTAGNWTGGFVNAVLRKAIREIDQIGFPDADQDPVQHISTYYSLPRWLAERWHRLHGTEKALCLARASVQRAPFTIRANALKCSPTDLIEALETEDCKVVPGTFAMDSLHVEKAHKPVMETHTFAKGWFQVQDEAAQLVTELLGPRPGETVMDACAGLGGKTGHIAQMMADKGSLLAMDRGSEKLARLRAEMTRLGVKMVTRREQDIICALDPGLEGQFDRVLVDAPCSGLGVIRRNPDVKWRVRSTTPAEQGLRQLQLLRKAAAWVKAKGVLVYSVCSTEPEESHDVARRFLMEKTDFQLSPAKAFLSPAARELVTPDGFLETDPALSPLDGFFAARFIKTTEQNG